MRRLYNAVCSVLEAYADSVNKEEETKVIPEKGLTDTDSFSWNTGQPEGNEMNAHQHRSWYDEPEDRKQVIGFTNNNNNNNNTRSK